MFEQKQSRGFVRAILAVMWLVGAAGVGFAGDDRPPGAGVGPTSGPVEFPPLDEVIKDMKTKPGFFTVYLDEKKDKLFARIPKGMLNKNFLLALSIARGPNFAGWQWGDGVLYWDKVGKKLVLMHADPRYAKGSGSTVQDVIARTYTDAIVKALPILTEVEGDVVIDLADLLKSDIAEVGSLFGGRLDRSLSRFGPVKNFEKNTELSVDAAITGKEGSGPIVGIHFSFSDLPQNDYEPRSADPRIGYFLVAQKDWSTGHEEKTIFKRYINRWRLRKAEPDRAVSDVLPEDQIVFYIEKTVPVNYRQYVREGILEWNKAFEAAGLRNAVVVHQQTDKNEFKDLDPEDVRYNFFRWIVSGIPFAMGPSRVNPFTGQILDADIIFDDSMVRYVLDEFDVVGPAATSAYTDAPVQEYLAHYPQEAGFAPAWDGDAHNALLPPGDHAPGEDGTPGLFGKADRSGTCELGVGMVRQLAFASAVAAAGGRTLPEEFIGQAIKETVMHEVGHTLGLRHNFKASSWLNLGEIKSRRTDEGRASTGSVMDYNPYSYAQSIAEQGVFATPTIGPYDYWAIEYGYRHYHKADDAKKGTPGDAPAKTEVASSGIAETKDGGAATNGEAVEPTRPTKANSDAEKEAETARRQGTGEKRTDVRKAPEGEAAMLKAIAGRCAEPGLAYATDEDTSHFYPDPSVNRWDNGGDPIEFARDRMAAIEKLWKDGLDWAVKDGDRPRKARQAFGWLLGEYGFVTPLAARLVGGQYVNRDHKGDACGRPPIQVVSAEKQREALKFLGDTVLSDRGFQFSPQMLNGLAAGRFGHWDTDDFDAEASFDLHSRILAIRAGVLFQLMNPFTVNRVYDAERQVPAGQDALTVPELFRTVSDMVWTELDQPVSSERTLSNRQPMISSFRRSIQRHHLQRLIDMVLTKPGAQMYPDAHAVARMTLKDLGGDIDRVVQQCGPRLDEFTRGHLVDSRKRIDKALTAEFIANPHRASSGPVIRVGAETGRTD